MILDAIALAACPIIPNKLTQHHRGKEGKDDGRCRRGRWPFLPRDVLARGVEIASDLPWDHGLDEQPHHREQGQGRNPFGLLQPYRTDGRGLLAPAQARLHRDVLCLICLKQLAIRTPCWPHRGHEDGPAGRVLGGHQGLCVPPEAIAALDLGCLRLRRPASPRPLLRHPARFALLVPGMIPPWPGLAPAPPLAAAFVVSHGCRRIGGPGNPSRCHVLAVRGQPLSFLGVGGGIRHRSLVGHRAGGHDEQAEFGPVEAPVRVLHGPQAGDTLPVPAPGRLLPCPTWLFEQERPPLLRLAPRLYLLPPCPGARPQGEEPSLALEAQAQRALTLSRASGPKAAHAVEAKGQTLCKGDRRLRTVAGRAITHAPTEREALTAHPETQKDLLELLTPLFAMPIGRPGWEQPCDRTGLLRIGPLQGERCRILLEPGGRDSLDVQGRECDGAQDALERCGTQRLQDLPQPRLMQGSRREAGLEPGDHATLLQACSHLIQGRMPIENRQEQGLHATAARAYMGGGGGQKVSMRAATLRLRMPPSTNGQWATGLIC